MSLSDIFAGFGLHSDQSVSTVAGDESFSNINVDDDDGSANTSISTLQGQGRGHVPVESSSFVSFDVEAMSVNSDTLQENGNDEAVSMSRHGPPPQYDSMEGHETNGDVTFNDTK